MSKKTGFLTNIKNRILNDEAPQPLSSQDSDSSIHSILQNLNKTIDSNIATMQKINTEEQEKMSILIKKSNEKITNTDNKDSPPFLKNYLQEHKVSVSQDVENEKETTTSNDNDLKLQISESESTEQKEVKIKLLTKQKVKSLSDNLKKRVYGQDHVIEEVVDILKVAALNIKINKEKPAGNYLFAGPSGVGKTELAQSVADTLEVPLLVLNMGEYSLEQDITKLIGTSPGYVGYQEGGILTNFVKANPSCIVLFDELEKAHPSIDKILLSIMDKGIAADNKGVKVIFTDTIIISTSNLGADLEYEENISKEIKDKYKMEAIKQGLRPEIINRYDSVFHFNTLHKDIYKMIVQKFLKQLTGRIQEEHSMNINITDKLLNFIVEKSYDPSMGGRPARRFIEKVVVKPLADYLIEQPDEDNSEFADHKLSLDLNKDSKICFKGKNNKIIRVLDNTEELVTRIENGKFTN